MKENEELLRPSMSLLEIRSKNKVVKKSALMLHEAGDLFFLLFAEEKHLKLMFPQERQQLLTSPQFLPFVFRVSAAWPADLFPLTSEVFSRLVLRLSSSEVVLQEEL